MLGPVIELSSLDGTNGFVLNGIDADDMSGNSVSNAGDVNGDGIDDLIIGAPDADPNDGESGESYVVFGDSTVGAGGTVELNSLNGSNGFVINGIERNDTSGSSVSSAGDINGDGIDDLIIGAFNASIFNTGPDDLDFTGESYVVFGSSTVGAGGTLELSSLNGSNGFVINGIDPFDDSGYSVSNAGDINGDRFDDVIIGAPGADPNGVEGAGQSYVVFGGATVGADGAIELSGLDGSNGFVINGIDENSVSGFSVSNAGDVNGDGVDDVIIGARLADGNGVSSGESYVVFGGSTVVTGGSFELNSLNGSNGFVLNGIDEGDNSGVSVSSAGDFNGDGIDDLIVGAFLADPNGGESGESYVVFGGSTVGAGGSFELNSLNGSNGFVINGIDEDDNSGNSVSSAGDFNGDGFDDLIIGAYLADSNGGSAGESYVVFGGSTVGVGGSFELNGLNGSNGFVINGIDGGDFSGISVSSAGDVNSDGLDDLIIGAPGGDSSGQSYVIFGRSSSGFNLDIDGDGEAQALTDGILVVRYLFGLTGDPLISNAIGAGASRSSADEIINYLDGARDTILDVDGNGEARALTDGILIVRYLFGLRGGPLIGDAIAPDANRTESVDIEAFLQNFDLPISSQDASSNLSFG